MAHTDRAVRIAQLTAAAIRDGQLRYPSETAIYWIGGFSDMIRMVPFDQVDSTLRALKPLGDDVQSVTASDEPNDRGFAMVKIVWFRR